MNDRTVSRDDGERGLRRILFAVFLVGVLGWNVRAQVAGYDEFEIVESTPVGTNLDNPDIRDAHEVWLEMINGASKSLDIEEFYVSTQAGEPLEDVLRAITAAARRGVRVRLIVDARMYRTYPEAVDALGKQPGISARMIDFGKLAGGIQHAKYFIVDGEEIFLGSQNFDWRALKHIHELGVRIRHEKAVRVYGEVFDLDWNLAEKNDPSTVSQFLHADQVVTPFTIVEGPGDTVKLTPTYSPKGLIPDSVLWDEPQIVSLIDKARASVLCQFLSYSPSGRGGSRYPVLDDALRRAAARGVRVRMIVSDWQKGTEAERYLKELCQVPNVEIKFSDIPDWSGGYIPFARVEHCKYLVIDSSSCWLGTSNWEKSYFYNTRNLGVVVENRSISGILSRVFLKSWDGQYTEPVKPGVEYRPRKHGEDR